MKIIILITVVETIILTLWLAYSSYRRRTSHLRIAATTGQSRVSSLIPIPEHWSVLNRLQVQGQQDDRQPMNGAVAISKEVAASVHRAFARKSHQLMFKKWSKDRHEN